jgi:hypothetical protein
MARNTANSTSTSPVVENTVQEDTGETIVVDEIIEAEVAESIAEPAPVVVAEVVPEPVAEPVAEPVFLEKPVFLEQWIRKVSGYEPEIIGGFEFFANSQGWHFDTPSEWKSKLSRWVNPAS